MNSHYSNLLDVRNLQEQVKKAFCYQKFFWLFTVSINCSSDLKNFDNSRPSASYCKTFSRSQEHFFLTVGQNIFGNKIPLLNRIMLLSNIAKYCRGYDKVLHGWKIKYINTVTNIPLVLQPKTVWCCPSCGNRIVLLKN